MQALEDLIANMNKHITTLFVTPNVDALSVSGRISKAVAKILKLAKFFPIVRTEDGNHKYSFFHK